MVISFYHEPSERSVFFKAFITAFNESYSSNFTPTEAFGRTDPIYQYKSTIRKITLAFKVLAASESEAFENLGRVSALEQMLYPSYTEAGSATTISQSPLIRLKVMNLLQKNSLPTQDQIINDAVDSERELFVRYSSTSQADLGLLGIIDNIAVNHGIESEDGVFYKRGAVNTILPKFIDINLSFSPLHETTLGWQEKEQINYLFPYGVNTTENVFSGSPANAISAYNEQVEKEKAAEQARRIRQQQTDNAKARYSGVLGDMRMKADVRRGGRGSDKALTNLASGIGEVEGAEEAFSEALELYGDQFIGEI
jgi:hypothetical protein